MTDKTEVLGEGKFVRLVKRGSWEMAERVGAGGAVLIIATTKKEELILVRQWREAVRNYVWEMPAGLCDVAGEASVETAKRELWEETGFEGADAEVLYNAPTSPGMASEMVEFVRISGCQKKGMGGGIEGEEITVAVKKLAEVPEFLARNRAEGDLVDARIYMALWVVQSEVRVQGLADLRDEMIEVAKGGRVAPETAGVASRTPGAKPRKI